MDVTTAQDGLTTVQRCWTLFAEGRIDEAFALLAPDFVAREAAGLPFSGEYHGVDGFRTLIARMGERMDMAHLSMDFRGAGDVVVSHAVVRFTERGSGRSAQTSVVELYTVRDGRIADLDIYYKDPAAITALVA